jgi:hypothetical protein
LKVASDIVTPLKVGYLGLAFGLWSLVFGLRSELHP